MIDELRLNTKLISFDGIIGRRDFAINIIYLCMINTLFVIPLIWYFASNIESIFDIFSLNKFFYSAPWLLIFWVLAGTVAIFCASLSNWIRRLNDINGFVNKTANIVLGVFAFLGAFGFVFPFKFLFLIGLINFIIFLVLLFKKGQITKNFPQDFRKDFNWGAFFGTWIWGLINKSYKTLWILLLSYTPIGFYYQLLCGFKGNEWAYKNRKWKSDEEFKSSQEKQTIAFVVLSVFVFPFIIMLLTIGLVFLITFTTIEDSKTSSNQESVTMNKIEQVFNSYTSLYFEKHVITEKENKFYVLPQDWNSYSFSEKKDILDMAAVTAATERSNNGKYSNKSKELPRTKIYSLKDEKLLGEFVIDEELLETDKPNFKEIFKASMQAYRFYKCD